MAPTRLSSEDVGTVTTVTPSFGPVPAIVVRRRVGRRSGRSGWRVRR